VDPASRNAAKRASTVSLGEARNDAAREDMFASRTTDFPSPSRRTSVGTTAAIAGLRSAPTFARRASQI
jgi:hypothetical protein